MSQKCMATTNQGRTRTNMEYRNIHYRNLAASETLTCQAQLKW